MPVAQLVEVSGLSPVQYGFESHRAYQRINWNRRCMLNPTYSLVRTIDKKIPHGDIEEKVTNLLKIDNIKAPVPQFFNDYRLITMLIRIYRRNLTFSIRWGYMLLPKGSIFFFFYIHIYK